MMLVTLVVSQDKAKKANGVGETLLWRKRVKDELQAGKNWAGKYGYMLGDRLRVNDSLEEFLRSEKIDPERGVGSLYNPKSGRPRFGADIDKQLGLKPIEHQTIVSNGPGMTGAAGEDSIQTFMESYLKKTGKVSR